MDWQLAEGLARPWLSVLEYRETVPPHEETLLHVKCLPFI